jgi:hypothetical protein
MKKLIILFALIIIIVYAAKFIIRLYGALKKVMSINEPEAAVPSQEE